MSLVKLAISNVRNIETARLTPSPGINLIVGQNASGKSALLESIHLLGRATSFRTSRYREIIRFQQDSLVVSGQAKQPGGLEIPVGVGFDAEGLQIRVNGQSGCSRSELAYNLPLQLIHPGSHALLEGGPQGRREFMDWGLFHLADDYLESWRKYRRALKQRNRLLRENHAASLDLWDRELSEYGTIVAQERQRYLALLTPCFERVARHFFGDERQFSLQSGRGWDPDTDLLRVLARERERDLKTGFTQSGPHKGDFRVRCDSRNVATFFSRGQIKLVVFVLKLAQYALLREAVGKTGCMLIDDVASELDDRNRDRILAFLADFDSQFFVTGLSADVFGQAAGRADCAIFHVERGCITQA